MESGESMGKARSGSPGRQRITTVRGPSAFKSGLQAGGQMKTIVVVFLQADALKKFQESEGWKAGVDGSVALVTLGAGGAVDTTNLKDPIVGFIFGQKGLMYNLTFEGSKFTKLKKK